MAEREQRGRVHRAARVPCGQARAQVRGRLPAGRGGHLDRQPAAGHQPPAKHSGDRAAALLAGEERLHRPGQLSGRRADGVRPPGDQHQHHRSAGGDQDPQQGSVPVREQHHGLLGQPPRQGAVAGRVEVEDLAVALRPGPAGIQQAEVALLAQHPGYGAVHQLLRHQAVPHRAGQRRAVAGDAGQLDVQARLQGQRGGLTRRRGHRVLGLQERDRVVVRDDQAVETQRVPQQAGQQLAIARYRDPVDVGVGRHDRPRAAPERHLERHQDDVGELAAADGHGGHVAPGPGRRVPGEMLQRGLDAGRLQAADVRRPDRADQVGVLADGLLGPSPARVPGHVEDRRQALVNAGRPHAGADARGHLADQPGVEGRAPGQRRRDDGGRPGGEAGQAFLVRHRRDAEPARRDDLGLQVA